MIKKSGPKKSQKAIKNVPIQSRKLDVNFLNQFEKKQPENENKSEIKSIKKSSFLFQRKLISPEKDLGNSKTNQNFGECKFCFDETILVKYAGCQHEEYVCCSCYGDLIFCCLKEGNKIDCQKCNYVPKYIECSRLIKSHQKEMMINELLVKYFSKSIDNEKKQDFVYCCECGQEQQPGGSEVLVCKKCEFETCAKHSMPYYRKSKFVKSIENSDFVVLQEKLILKKEKREK